MKQVRRTKDAGTRAGDGSRPPVGAGAPLGAGGPEPRSELQMVGDATSLCDARNLVAETLADAWPELRDVAVLLTGELVTNAVLHGGGRFQLRVDTGQDRLRVEVTDSSDRRPRLLQASSEREHGRGMAIVDALASRWGSHRQGTHKVVWFEIRLGPRDPPGSRPRRTAAGNGRA